jgi:hypothetical protein
MYDHCWAFLYSAYCYKYLHVLIYLVLKQFHLVKLLFSYYLLGHWDLAKIRDLFKVHMVIAQRFQTRFAWFQSPPSYTLHSYIPGFFH